MIFAYIQTDFKFWNTEFLYQTKAAACFEFSVVFMISHAGNVVCLTKNKNFNIRNSEISEFNFSISISNQQNDIGDEIQSRFCQGLL